MEQYTVYILFSEAANEHYTGFTSNLDQPLVSHNQLGVGWTSKFRPWKLIFTKEVKTKAEALKFEKGLKSGAERDFIKTLRH